jgi:hypothetical protein
VSCHNNLLKKRNRNTKEKSLVSDSIVIELPSSPTKHDKRGVIQFCVSYTRHHFHLLHIMHFNFKMKRTNNRSMFQNSKYSSSQLWRSMKKLWNWHLFMHHKDWRNADEHCALKINWICNSTAVLVFSCLSYTRVYEELCHNLKWYILQNNVYGLRFPWILGKQLWKHEILQAAFDFEAWKPWNNI